MVASARERAREADLLRFGLGEIEAVDPKPGEDAQLAADEARLGYADALRTAAEQAREALSSEAGDPDALGAPSAARTLLEGVREHDAEAGALADRLAEVTYLLSDLAADVASYAASVDADPARLAAVSERRAALTALTRKYGETVEEVLAWSEASAVRLLDLDGTDERIEALRAEQRSLRERARRGGRRPSPRPAPRPPPGSRREVTAELALLAMPDARLEITVTQHDAERAGRRPAAQRQPAAGRRALAAAHRQRGRRGRVPAGRQHRLRAAAAAQGRVRRRAVPGDAGPRGRPGRDQPGADVRLRRGRRRRRRRRCGRGRPPAGPAGHGPRRCWS